MLPGAVVVVAAGVAGGIACACDMCAARDAADAKGKVGDTVPARLHALPVVAAVEVPGRFKPLNLPAASRYERCRDRISPLGRSAHAHRRSHVGGRWRMRRAGGRRRMHWAC